MKNLIQEKKSIFLQSLCVCVNELINSLISIIGLCVILNLNGKNFFFIFNITILYNGLSKDHRNDMIV